jgi:REP element-mobilizing transposase RayT
MCAGARRDDFRVVHHSIQGNHIHLIVEAVSKDALRRGMQGLNIRMARALNKALNMKGQIFEDRYHMHVLRCPRETLHAIRYVTNNRNIHRARAGLAATAPDPCETSIERPFTRPRTWLLREGWRRAL